MSEHVFHNVEEVLKAYGITKKLTFEEEIQKLLDEFRAAVLSKEADDE